MRSFFTPCVAIIATIMFVGCDVPREKMDPVVFPQNRFVKTEPDLSSKQARKSKKCAIDTIDNTFRGSEFGWRIKQKHPTKIRGWAFSNDGRNVEQDIYIQLDGPVETYFARASDRIIRPDVNKFWHASSTLKTGFEFIADTIEIGPGIYEVSILQAVGSGVERCAVGATLVVE